MLEAACKSSLQLFNGQEVQRMLTNDNHGLQSFLRLPTVHTSYQRRTPALHSPTPALPKAAFCILMRGGETRREVKAWQSFRGSQMND